MSAPVKRRAPGAAAKKLVSAAWLKCECGEWRCTIHDNLHAADCSCPPVNKWTIDPYSTPLTQAQKDAAREANP